MEEFEQYIASLRQTREEKNGHSAAIQQLQAREAGLKRQLEDAARAGNQDLQTALSRQQRSLSGQQKEAEAGYLEGKKRALSGLEELVRRFGTPRDYIRYWDDQTPILLFPLRVETRFNPAAVSPELWVRVFPDECSAVKFRPGLTEDEQKASRRFWFETWKATDEPGRLAAWNALVKGFGPNRAAWIAKSTEPLNLPAVEGVALPFPPDATGFAPEELAAGRRFWKDFWFGNPDAEAILTDAVGPDRLMAVRNATEPIGGLPAAAPQQVFDSQVQFPALPTEQAPASYADVLPDQLVFMGFDGDNRLFEVAGRPIPDRVWLSPEVSQLDGAVTRDGNGQLQFTGELEWVQHFDAAVAIGLGIRIDLRQAIRSGDADAVLQKITTTGLDRLLVLGINAVDGKTNGSSQLEKLLSNHHYGSSGLAFVPQGTPTNNTDASSAGPTQVSAEESYQTERLAPLYLPETGVPFHQKTNGQRTAEILGLSDSVFQHIAHSQDRELAEARAMNTALYNATLGYFFDEMLSPLVSRADQHRLFTFFTGYVTGRGSLPAIRIGKQPYGLLPVTSFSKWVWTNEEMRDGLRFRVRFFEEMQRILQIFRNNWQFLQGLVPHAGSGKTDLNDEFLKMLGLNPTSVSYAHRWLYGRQFIRNWFFWASGKDASQELADAWKERAKGFLKQFGLAETSIVSKTYSGHPVPLDGIHLIDTVPLSEEAPVQPLYKKADGQTGPNYLAWLRDSPESDILRENLQTDTGEPLSPPPTLLYALLRQAIHHSYWDTAMKLYEDFAGIDHAARRETELRHIAGDAQGNVVRQFAKTDYLVANMRDNLPQLSTKNQRVSDYIFERASLPLTPDSNLHLVRQALEQLEKLPTARLERLFAEHIDLCTYRLDAWENGMLQKRLEHLRTEKSGIYLGAFGWVEKLKPAPARPVVGRGLPPEFAQEGRMYEASQNGAFIHAPSLPQAVTSALLRAGYLAHSGPTDRERLNINLSSDRVRRALWLLEGIRKGQELAALLGYQFERALHDHDLDTYVYAFRDAFPFKIKETDVQPGQSLEAVSARNVVDGYALGRTTASAYPFGMSGLPGAATAEGKLLLAALDALRDSMDAVGDLLLSESVHQFVQGNQLKANASLKTIQEGQNPGIPDFVQTPRSGNAMTTRVFVHLDPTVVAGAADSPRVKAEPALQHWLHSYIGSSLAAGRVAVRRTADERAEVSLGTLGLTAIQWTALSPIQQKTVLGSHYAGLVTLETGEVLEIQITATEVEPEQPVRYQAIRTLKQEIPLNALGLSALDWAYLAENQQSELEKRICYQFHRTIAVVPGERFEVLYREAVSAGTSLQKLAPLLRSLQQLIRKSRALQAMDYRVPGESKPSDPANTGLADLPDLLSRVGSVQVDLQAVIDAFETEKTALTTIFSDGNPPPAQITAVQALVTARVPAWEQLFRTAAGYDCPEVYPSAPLSVNPAVDLPDEESLAELVKLMDDQTYGSPNNRPLFQVITQLLTTLRKLTDKKAASLKATAEASGLPVNDQVPLLIDALRVMVGKAQLIVPKFRLENGPEVDLAFQNRDKLFRHKTDQLRVTSPALGDDACRDLITEEWLQSLARVRPRVAHLEQVRLAGGLLAVETPLTPVQLPYLKQPYWVSLDMPETLPDPDDATKTLPVRVDRDYLSIVTLGLGSSPVFGGPLCGILVDEWTEVIPVRTETTGIAVNYNQPNAESPQTWLIAVAPELTGKWDWDTLVGILQETLSRAKQRAVEPDQVAQYTNLGQLLPATVTPQSSDPDAGSFLAYSKLYVSRT